MKKNEKYYQIAIDGPAGSGKSTIAKSIAAKLDFLYIDSGAMYRALTLFMIEKKLLTKSDTELSKHIKKIKIGFYKKNAKQLVFLNNTNVTNKIRSSTVNKHVSEVSARKAIREELVKRQRDFALHNSIVMDGRDIGSTVFQDADLKIYLTASPYIRAKRRQKDLQTINEKISIKELIKQIQGRDNYDSSRRISPLCKAQDTIVIDSTNLTINKVLEKISTFLPIII
ncbi:MAG: (d)CMP kinase [Candidatus Melainabacteria bacterium]|nr:(d)CMP kinase [Candidatus Melainabacteria bacterium]